MTGTLRPQISAIRSDQVTLAASLAVRTSPGYREFPIPTLMEINEHRSWESMSKKLEISECDESHLQGRADSLAAIGRV